MSWAEAILDAVFPRRCGLCGLVSGRGICDPCRDEMKSLTTPIIRSGERDPVQLNVSLFEYEGRVAQAVRRLKYERVTSLGDPMAAIMKAGWDALNLPPLDLVLPVPIHWRRLCWRGFNQAELLARDMQSGSSREGLLRVRSTRPQVGLSASDRLTNLEGAFKASDVVRGRSVLLVDDVFTSGSTARECGISLRAAGASMVGIFTFARSDDLRAS